MAGQVRNWPVGVAGTLVGAGLGHFMGKSLGEANAEGFQDRINDAKALVNNPKASVAIRKEMLKLIAETER
tara:strand:+ start:388 stop:600 length:213 start_codon:yes stop_codon:yes gene_type:complete